MLIESTKPVYMLSPSLAWKIIIKYPINNKIIV